MYKSLPSNITKKTYNNIISLFDKYTFLYSFNREDIQNMFEIKKSRASEIIALLLKYNLIEDSESTRYIFKK